MRQKKTKGMTASMQQMKKTILFLFIFTLILGFYPQKMQIADSVEAASTITVKYKANGKQKTFKGNKRKVSINSKTVSISKTPIIVINGYNMAPYYEVLVKGSGKIKGSYSPKSKKIILSGNGHKVTLKLNAKTAYVDGRKKTLSVAPQFITYTSSRKTRIVVPIKNIAGYLGFSYKWNGKTNTIELKTSVTPATTEQATTEQATTATTTETSSTTESTATTEAEIEDPDTFGVSSIEVPGAENEDETDDLDGFSYTMYLNRPSEIEKGTIVCTDDYQSRRLKISMPGNQTGFYAQNKPHLASGVSFSCKYDGGSNKTILYFTTKTIKGFQVKEDSSSIYIKHGSPTSMFKNVIVLDAGHGGSDTGATGNGYKEKNMTLAIVKAAKTYFDQNPDYKVYYTRLKDTYPSLSARYKLANEVKADIFISVHINSAGKKATGTETLYNPDRNKKSPSGLSCYKLASYTQKYVLAATGFKNRGLKKRCYRLGNGLAVLSHNNRAATLTEIGFISNPSEAKKMNQKLSSYGKAIYDAVIAASSDYKTNR